MEIKFKFHFFRQNNFTYLDSAATTQVPDVVVHAVAKSLGYKGNPSRGAHPIAVKNEQLLNEARENIARFIGAEAKEVIFTNNTTDSLNLAVDSISDHIGAGGEIIVAISEHHSNLLPYTKLTKRGAKIKIVGTKDGIINISEIEQALSARTCIVAVGHCSNVLGNINDVAAIGNLVKEYNNGIYYIVDGAQAVAHIPVDIKEMKADFYAFSGHKMYGPDGIGVLYVNQNIQHLLSPIRIGGGTVANVAVTFGQDGDIISPDYFPSMITLEGGTPNASSILGLSKAVDFIRTIGFSEIRNHELALTKMLIEGLLEIPGIKIVGPVDLAKKIGVVSFSLNEFSPQELGDYLGRQKICIRYGSHCAFPLAEYLGQETLRVSLGVYSLEDDIKHLLQNIKLFLGEKKGLAPNPNLELLRSKAYFRKTHLVNSFPAIAEKIKQSLHGTDDMEVVVMGGHFLGIPDTQENKFWPGIKSMIPVRLHGLLEEFGMTNFPLFTWGLACKTVADLKDRGYKAKLSIIANDTTGINDLRLTQSNKTKKTAQVYREELFASFKEDGDLPYEYVSILKEHGLDKNDILQNGKDYFFRETLLRAGFREFISKNKRYFDGLINYSMEENGSIDLSINVLDNQEIKVCTFNTFQSKTGGKFCTAELCEFMAELFGKSEAIRFEYLSEKVKKPKSTSTNKVLITFTPGMCDSAVIRSAELYCKVLLEEKGNSSFKFFNIPLGPNAERNLFTGTELTYISNKEEFKML